MNFRRAGFGITPYLPAWRAEEKHTVNQILLEKMTRGQLSALDEDTRESACTEFSKDLREFEIRHDQILRVREMGFSARHDDGHTGFTENSGFAMDAQETPLHSAFLLDTCTS